MQNLPPIIPGDDYPLTVRYFTPTEGCDDRERRVPEPQDGNSIRVVVVRADNPKGAKLFDEVFQAISPDKEDGRMSGPIPGASTASFPPKTDVLVQVQRTTASGGKDTPILAVVKVLQAAI